MKILDVVTSPVYIDVYEESLKSSMRGLTEEQLKIIENTTTDFEDVKNIISKYKKEYNINISQSDIGKTFCPVSLWSIIPTKILEVKNAGNYILVNIDNDGTCYFRNGTTHFKFPDDKESENAYYSRVICSDDKQASQMLLVIKLEFPATWQLKGA